MRFKKPILVALFSLLSALPAIAHHSFGAEFDESKPIELKGTVTKVEWSNPHVYFYVDVKGNDGTVVNWGLETDSPGGLIRRGWTRTSLKVGDQVSIKGYVAKDGSHLADARLVTLADGRKVYGGTAGDGGPGDPAGN
ncbi:MAG: DUF6152 family protein [Candidatus Acidiferrales bacterium]|jgi:hypothetical protein